MTRASTIAEATRRFVEADRKHAIAQAKSTTTTAASDRMARNRAAYRQARQGV